MRDRCSHLWVIQFSCSQWCNPDVSWIPLSALAYGHKGSGGAADRPLTGGLALRPTGVELSFRARLPGQRNTNRSHSTSPHLACSLRKVQLWHLFLDAVEAPLWITTSHRDATHFSPSPRHPPGRWLLLYETHDCISARLMGGDGRECFSLYNWQLN